MLRSPRGGSWISLTPYEAGLFASILTDTAPLDQESIDDIPLSVMFSSTQSPMATAARGVETTLVMVGALSVPVTAAGDATLNLVSNLFVVGNSVNLKFAAAPESNTV